MHLIVDGTHRDETPGYNQALITKDIFNSEHGPKQHELQDA